MYFNSDMIILLINSSVPNSWPMFTLTPYIQCKYFQSNSLNETQASQTLCLDTSLDRFTRMVAVV